MSAMIRPVRGFHQVAQYLRRQHPTWTVLHATERRVTIEVAPSVRVVVGQAFKADADRAFVSLDGLASLPPSVPNVLEFGPDGSGSIGLSRTVVWNAQPLAEFLAL